MSDLEAIGWKPHATKEGVYMRPTEGIERLVTFLVGVGAPPNPVERSFCEDFHT